MKSSRVITLFLGLSDTLFLLTGVTQSVGLMINCRNERESREKTEVGVSGKQGIRLDRGELLIVFLHALVWEKHFHGEADFLGMHKAVGIVKAQDI